MARAMLFPAGMRALPLAALALAAVLGAVLPATLTAQDKGKIGDVQRSADSAKRHGARDGGDAEGGGWFFGGWHGFVHVFFGVYPRDTGQGYQSYPYAADPSATFVLRDVTDGRTFGAASATYFLDDQSSLRAGHFSVEWAGGFVRREIEFSSYVEPRTGGTDHLQMFRVSLSAVPPLGDVGYLKLGAGLQIVTLGSGDAASGPEFEAGVQLFPRRPFGVAATARVAPLTWSGGPEFGLGFVDLAGSGSVFVGRFELQAGYRWTRIGVGRPFRGPTAGMRVWF
jgi:hypothetical protein